jgi:hypothetical protein
VCERCATERQVSDPPSDPLPPPPVSEYLQFNSITTSSFLRFKIDNRLKIKEDPEMADDN